MARAGLASLVLAAALALTVVQNAAAGNDEVLADIDVNGACSIEIKQLCSDIQAPAVEPEQAPAVEPEQAPAVEPEQAPAVQPEQAPAVEPEQAPAVELEQQQPQGQSKEQDAADQLPGSPASAEVIQEVLVQQHKNSPSRQQPQTAQQQVQSSLTPKPKAQTTHHRLHNRRLASSPTATSAAAAEKSSKAPAVVQKSSQVPGAGGQTTKGPAVVHPPATGAAAVITSSTASAAASSKVDEQRKPVKPRNKHAPQQHMELAALKILKTKMHLTFPVTDPKRLMEGPLHAKCLKTAMMTDHHNEPLLSNNCTTTVVSFYESLAEDSARDYQLVASCAEDIVRHCSHSSSTQLMSCLLHHKAELKRFCSAAVNARLAGSSGVPTWDQGIANNCSNELQDLCADELDSDRQLPASAGFAYACLHEKIQVMNSLQNADQFMSSLQVGKDCKKAIFQRQIVEAEDMRFNKGLTDSCSSELQHFCDDVSFGRAEAMTCLERHMHDTDFGVSCADAIEAVQLVRVSDARLDWKLRHLCRLDIEKLCSEPEYVGGLDPQLMLEDWDAPFGAGQNVTYCLRRQLVFIQSEACQRHVRAVAAKAFANPLLDIPLLHLCHENISQHCEHPSDNYDYLPEVVNACHMERSKYCAGVPSQYGAALDCLNEDALTGQLILAVSDIRLMTSLERGCASAVDKLCPDLEPGSARVIDCLQSKMNLVKSGTCRRQLVRLQGFAAHDYRLDFSLHKVQELLQEAGHGRVHACLRENEQQLDAACKREVHKIEAREHERLSLSPIIKGYCEQNIKSFCGSIHGSLKQLVPCLIKHMEDPTFAADCKKVLTEALARKAQKYHLLPSIKAACDADVKQRCNWSAADVAADPHLARLAFYNASVKGDSKAWEEGQELHCLSVHLGSLSHTCRQELAMEIHQQLLVYMPGMPLTAACDQDAKRLCDADSADTVSVLQVGSLLGCLATNVDKLSPSCWSLVAVFDKQQLDRAKQLVTGSLLEADADSTAVGMLATTREERIRQGAINVDEVVDTVSKQVQGQLHDKLQSSLSEHIKQYSADVAKGAHSAGFLWGVLAAGSLIAIFAGGFLVVQLRSGRGMILLGRANRDGGATVVVKDGRA
eukprot:gene13418-13546_t